MSIGPNRWQEQRKAAKASRPRPTIEACEVRPRWGSPGYKVTIRGSNIITPGIFLDVRIGDQRVTELHVAKDGEITGVVAEKPESLDVAIGVGSIEARAPIAMLVRPATPDVGDLLDVLTTRWERILGQLRNE